MRPALTLVLVALSGLPTNAECPDPDSIRTKLAGIDLTRAARTARFHQPVPTKLHEAAMKKVGKPVSTRDGQRVTGVIVAPVAAEAIWRAINDEEHHAEGFLPVKFSRVVDGRPRGMDRVLFQYYLKAGVGRWWASRVLINDAIHKATEGKIWELYWYDWMDEVDREKSPISEIRKKIRPIESSEGSWMLVPLTESCTLVEEYSRSDPGGALGVIQALVAAGAIRDTLTGVVKMAEEHSCEPAKAASFVGPDGKPLDREPVEDQAVEVPSSSGRPR